MSLFPKLKPPGTPIRNRVKNLSRVGLRADTTCVALRQRPGTRFGRDFAEPTLLRGQSHMNLRGTTLLHFASLSLLIIPGSLQAQVTHGQKPSLPAPFASRSSDNAPREVRMPEGFLPTVPNGFRVNVFAKDFKGPRLMTLAPNGDIFLADTGADQIVILRDPNHSGGAQERVVFAAGLRRPFGIAFHDDYVYVGNMTSVVRFKYDPKTSKRTGEAEKLMDLPGGGHITRALTFTDDGKLLVAVGSGSNIDTGEPDIRAAVTIADPDGNN